MGSWKFGVFALSWAWEIYAVQVFQWAEIVGFEEVLNAVQIGWPEVHSGLWLCVSGVL